MLCPTSALRASRSSAPIAKVHFAVGRLERLPEAREPARAVKQIAHAGFLRRFRRGRRRFRGFAPPPPIRGGDHAGGRISTSTIAVVMMNAFFRMPSRRVKRKTVHISLTAHPPLSPRRFHAGRAPGFQIAPEEPLLHHLFEKRPGRGVPADPNSQPSAVSSIRRRPCLGEGAYILRTGYRQVRMPIPRLDLTEIALQNRFPRSRRTRSGNIPPPSPSDGWTSRWSFPRRSARRSRFEHIGIDRVKAAERLVQEDQLGVVQDGRDQLDLLLVALGSFSAR